MCFPTIDGVIDVEERPPRYAGETRRKRLRFVSDPRYKKNEERSLVRSSPRRYEQEDAWEEEEGWQRHQQHQQRQQLQQLQQLQHQQYQLQLQQQQQQQQQQRQQWQQQQQQQQQQQLLLHQHEQRLQSLGHHPQPHGPQAFQHMPHQGRVHQNPQQDYGNRIQGIEEWNPGNQGNHVTHMQPRHEEWNSGHQGNHPHHGQHRLIEAAPRARLPQHLRAHARRRQSRSPRRSRYDQLRDSSSGSSDSLDDSLLRGRHGRRSESRRFDPYDSFEDLGRPRQRSRSARRIRTFRR